MPGVPVTYLCRECKAENEIYEYVEFIDCRTCKRRIKLSAPITAHLKKAFPNGLKLNPDDYTTGESE